jgi:uncharacterized membrane-anchored protein YitT (DUF2179 family)
MKIAKKNRWLIKRSIYLILGLFIFSFGFSFFLSPNNLVFGGVSGLSITMREVLGIDTSLFVLLVNMGLLVISFFILGKEKTLCTILGATLLPFFMKLTDIISDQIDVGNIELLVSAIFGGVLTGIGLGLVYKGGFTTGGTDIVNQIINKFFKFGTGKSMFLVDFTVVASGIFVFGVNKFLYALISLYLMTRMADRVILGIGQAKAFYIVTDKTKEVKEFIIKKLGHGVTILEAIGGYSKEDQKVLFCVIPSREYYILKEGIHRIDDESFVVVCDAYEVYGGEYEIES